MFLIKHGVGEGLFYDGADFSRDAERDLMDGFEGMLVEERLFSPRQFEVMGDIVFGFFGIEAWHVVTDGDSLVEGFHDGKLHDPLQVGLTAEDQDEGVIGVHLKVGEQPQFFEGAGLEKMSFIDDQEDGFSRAFFGFEKRPLDLAIDGAFGEPGGKTEEAI